MSGLLVQPEGVSDRVWHAIKADHNEIVGRRACNEYRALAQQDGEFKRHYTDMYEMLFEKWATPEEKQARNPA